MNIAPTGRGVFLPGGRPVRQRTLIVAMALALFVIAGIDPRVGLLLAGVVIGTAVLLTFSSFPYLGVCALVATITFEMIRLVPSEGGTATISKTVGGAVAAAWGLALVRGRIHRPSLGENLPVVAAMVFVAWATLTVAWAADADLGIAKATSFGLLLVSIVITATSVGTGLQLRRVAQFHVALGLCVAAVSIGVALTSGGSTVEYQPWGTEEELVRTIGFTGDPNEFAAAQVLAFSVAVALASNATTSTGRALYVGAALVVSGSIITTASRGGLLALLVVVALWIASSRRAILWMAVAIAALAGLNALGAFDIIVGRTQVGGSDPRLLIWDVGIDVWRDHFVFGLGVGGFPDAFFANQFRSGLPIPSVDRPITAHNVFLGVAAETGLVGLLLFLGMLAATFVALASAARHAASSQVRSTARGYLIGLLGFLVAAFFLSAELAKWLWLIVGLSATFARFDRTQPRGREP